MKPRGHLKVVIIHMVAPKEIILNSLMIGIECT